MHPTRRILFDEEVAGDGHHAHVNAGHQTMTSADTRVSVIVGVCRKDPERWREFDAIYRPMLFAFLRKQGLPEFEAQDVVQDIFVKLLGKIHTYDRERSRFRSWLFSVAHHTMVDQARRRASERKAVDGWVVQMLRATDEESRQMEQDWILFHRRRILEIALKRVRAQTSSRVWACFEQRLLRGRPGAEVGRELRLEPNAVFVSSSRVLKQVRAVCQEFDEDLIDDLDPSLPGRD